MLTTLSREYPDATTVALIKFANMSLHVKMHQEKKTAIKKNSTVIDRESDSLSITVEFLIGFFFLGAFLHAGSC